MKPPVEDRFEIDIFWSDEGGAYVAVIPHCTAWGESYQEALAQVRVALRANIEFGLPGPNTLEAGYRQSNSRKLSCRF